MSLIQCKDCHKIISSNAKVCLHCGREKTSIFQATKNTIFLSIAIFILLFFISIFGLNILTKTEEGREIIAKEINTNVNNNMKILKKVLNKQFKQDIFNFNKKINQTYNKNYIPTNQKKTDINIIFNGNQKSK